MIADSPWINSPWQQEMGLSSLPIFDDISSIEKEIERVRRQNEMDLDELLRMNTYSNVSTNPSVASSDCSDEIAQDDLAECFMPVFDEFIESANLLAPLDVDLTENSNNNLEVCELESPLPSTDLLLDDVPLYSESESNSTDSTSESRKRCRSKSAERVNKTKKWSTMSDKEQLSAVEDLTEIISNKLGLREQLEVIRIINPQATVLDSDTEFVIDLFTLNDEKMKQVKDYVREHIDQERPSSSCEEDRPTSSCDQRCDSCSESSSDCGSTSTQSSPQSSRKKSNKKQQRRLAKETRRQNRKEYRQMMREKRSGLFEQEEVLALTSKKGPDDEDDIDILT